MFCATCGRELPPDASFCLQCGAAVRSGALEPSQESSAPTAQTLRRISWSVAAVGLVGGIALTLVAGNQPNTEKPTLPQAIVLLIVCTYTAWSWYWGVIALYRHRQTFFVQPLTFVAGLFSRTTRDISTKETRGIHIIDRAILRLLALLLTAAVFAIMLAVLLEVGLGGAAVYGLFGGGVYEFINAGSRRTTGARAAESRTDQP